MTKQCKGCAQWKPMDEFYSAPANRDGREGTCRDCKIARKKERYANDPAFREHCRDYARDYHKERYAHDPAFRQSRLDSARRYYHKTGKAQVTERGDTWVWAYAYRCKKAGLSPVIERFSRQDVIDEYGSQCFYCHHGEFEHLDHFIPVAQGGPHTLDNVRPSCAKCNWAKWSSDPLEFAASSMAVDDPDEADATSALPLA